MLRVAAILLAVLLVACEEIPADPCIPIIRLGPELENLGNDQLLQQQLSNKTLDAVRESRCITNTLTACADGSTDSTHECPINGFALLPTTGQCPLGTVLDDRRECRLCPPGFAATFDGTQCVPDTAAFNTCGGFGSTTGCYDSSRDALGMPGFISAGAAGAIKSATCDRATQLANIACGERSSLLGNKSAEAKQCKRTLPCDCLCAFQSVGGCACNVYGEYFPGTVPPAFSPLDPLIP